MLPTALLEDLASAWTDLAAPTRIGIMGLGVFLGVQLWNMIPAKDSQHDEPPYLPYSIPWVGHTLAFARDSSRVFHTALQRFGLQPFTLKIAGQKHYVLTHPSDVQAVFKASRSLTFDGSTAQVLKLIYGMTDDPDISELVETLKTYLGDTEEGVQLRKGALPIVVGREEVMKLAGVSLDGRARGVLTILQAFHTNSAPTSFWFILYCILTPGLLPRVLAEISPAYSAPSAPGEQPNVDIAYLTNQKACPLFHSVYTEVLRLVSSTVSVRVVDQDTPNIGGYTLYKGAKVFCPGRPLQLSEEFWGAEAKEFKAERFVTRPQDGTGLKMRPFGGGPTLCPGRHFAALEVKTFVAGALMRFNFEFPEGMPEMDVKTPCLGVMRSVGVCMAKISPRPEWIKLCASTAEEKIAC
ncbi:hypothetical protein FRC00_005481 [Tulasnella sp. 408]|nr:hypothetical protein FRC00_005481 [Tulasnella sp. 408]